MKHKFQNKVKNISSEHVQSCTYKFDAFNDTSKSLAAEMEHHVKYKLSDILNLSLIRVRKWNTSQDKNNLTNKPRS